MIPRTLVFLFFLCALPANPGRPQNPPATESAPPSPFIDKGACPFECCTYREWAAKQEISLVDQPNGKKVVAQLLKGEKVQGVTGEVHSIPVRAIALAIRGGCRSKPPRAPIGWAVSRGNSDNQDACG